MTTFRLGPRINLGVAVDKQFTVIVDEILVLPDTVQGHAAPCGLVYFAYTILAHHSSRGNDQDSRRCAVGNSDDEDRPRERSDWKHRREKLLMRPPLSRYLNHYLHIYMTARGHAAPSTSTSHPGEAKRRIRSLALLVGCFRNSPRRASRPSQF